MTAKRFLGGRAGRALARPPDPTGCLKMNSVHTKTNSPAQHPGKDAPDGEKEKETMPGASHGRPSRRLRASDGPVQLLPPPRQRTTQTDILKAVFSPAFNSPGGEGGGFHVAKAEWA